MELRYSIWSSEVVLYVWIMVYNCVGIPTFLPRSTKYEFHPQYPGIANTNDILPCVAIRGISTSSCSGEMIQVGKCKVSVSFHKRKCQPSTLLVVRSTPCSNRVSFTRIQFTFNIREISLICMFLCHASSPVITTLMTNNLWPYQSP